MHLEGPSLLVSKLSPIHARAVSIFKFSSATSPPAGSHIFVKSSTVSESWLDYLHAHLTQVLAHALGQSPSLAVQRRRRDVAPLPSPVLPRRVTIPPNLSTLPRMPCRRRGPPGLPMEAGALPALPCAAATTPPSSAEDARTGALALDWPNWLGQVALGLRPPRPDLAQGRPPHCARPHRPGAFGPRKKKG
ncbi:hypothetical protein PR202_ga16359 [Eleusine coracana subsp. coracana]|uniref:Uncharacterized protein n=1 Tax=Eleusine coracana subsp. coracana TaxID=191504 RepID=A0AAV5CMM0_ELECO|nr:hypothetical protein PR202_ga16359 [Eleusine coracana subsp. coracana]